MKKILFVTYGGGHSKMVIPVIRELESSSEYEYDVLALTTACSDMEQEGIPYKSFKDFPISDEARAYGERLLSETQQSGRISVEETVAYLGASFEELALSLGAEKARAKYCEHGRRAFLPVKFLERVISSDNYHLVVSTNSPRAEQASIVAAQNLGIPTLCMVDLGISVNQIPWIVKPGFGDKICVLSNAVKKGIVLAGRDEEEIVVTGNPAFDSLSKFSGSKSQESLRGKNGWRKSEKIVLWASNNEPKKSPFSDVVGDPELPRKIEQQLLQALDESKFDRLIFRPHPNENVFYSGLPNSVTISPPSDPIEEVLAVADCVVIINSTVGLQAAILDKPLVSVYSAVTYDHSPKYDVLGLASRVDNICDLGEAVLDAINNGTAVSKIDASNASQRVFAQIKRLLSMRK
jgi:hypothetical protein